MSHGVGHELRAEVHSAQSVDIVIAFIRFSGIYPLLEVLKRHRAGGKRIRVLTTTYTNSTEQRALDALIELGAEVRVSVRHLDYATARQGVAIPSRRGLFNCLRWIVEPDPLGAGEWAGMGMFGFPA